MQIAQYAEWCKLHKLKPNKAIVWRKFKASSTRFGFVRFADVEEIIGRALGPQKRVCGDWVLFASLDVPSSLQVTTDKLKYALQKDYAIKLQTKDDTYLLTYEKLMHGIEEANVEHKFFVGENIERSKLTDAAIDDIVWLAVSSEDKR